MIFKKISAFIIGSVIYPSLSFAGGTTGGAGGGGRWQGLAGQELQLRLESIEGDNVSVSARNLGQVGRTKIYGIQRADFDLLKAIGTQSKGIVIESQGLELREAQEGLLNFESYEEDSNTVLVPATIDLK